MIKRIIRMGEVIMLNDKNIYFGTLMELFGRLRLVF